MLMAVDSLLEGSYWVAAVAEGDTDGGSFTDKDNDMQASFC